MNNIIFWVMRRMRVPLLVLLTVYTVAVVGMTLIDGVDDQGRPWRMDFFHAFYFVSFMGTTIGFGEIPYPFSNAQRMWVTLSIYMTVVAWIYAIGTLLSLLQDEALRRTMIENRFARTVGNIREPFYLICGYGDTGRALVKALEERFMRSVVIEKEQERINVLMMQPRAFHTTIIDRLSLNTLNPPVTKSSPFRVSTTKEDTPTSIYDLLDPSANIPN